jgi:hypothetical protein
MARSQGVLSPVRVARILAGEGPGQFSSDSSGCEVLDRPSVPLSVALKYIGGILDESSQKILRLKVSIIRQSASVILAVASALTQFYFHFCVCVYRKILRNIAPLVTLWRPK